MIRPHTEIIKPPRALWVPFELGRPFGVPNNPAFQKRVLMAALNLLEATNGPVLMDFLEDAPEISTNEPMMLACPYVPQKEQVNQTKAEDLCSNFKVEMTSMRPWYEQAVKARGRSIVGISKLTPEIIADFLCSFLSGIIPQNPREDVSLVQELRYAAEDLKAYYYEAITAQPGAADLTSQVLDKWFWDDTIAGTLLRGVRDVCINSKDEALRLTGLRSLIPQRTLVQHTED
ncbi:MAG: hypothetical protein NUK65_02260 [Firmicutes bacterium]|nr:hypothetical protein [Bacillota bacterium]